MHTQYVTARNLCEVLRSITPQSTLLYPLNSSEQSIGNV